MLDILKTLLQKKEEESSSRIIDIPEGSMKLFLTESLSEFQEHVGSLGTGPMLMKSERIRGVNTDWYYIIYKT